MWRASKCSPNPSDRTPAGADLAEVEHDRDQIHQVLLNLLLMRYKPWTALAPCVSTSVRGAISPPSMSATTGRGIPPKNLTNILSAFLHHQGNGTGLGLSLARRIVEDIMAHRVSSIEGREASSPYWCRFRRPRLEAVPS